jgi:hypothetical protein
MTRLSFQTCLECSTLVSWLQLLHTYFQELLWQPIAQAESCQDDCLEGSPFLLCVSDGEIHLHSRHIQRQAVFLFIKFSFTLMSLKANSENQCVCATPNSCLTYESNSGLECCFRKKGLLELHKWLQGHLPTETFLDHEMYLERCVNFASSLLQLFMHEVCLFYPFDIITCNVAMLCNSLRFYILELYMGGTVCWWGGGGGGLSPRQIDLFINIIEKLFFVLWPPTNYELLPLKRKRVRSFKFKYSRGSNFQGAKIISLKE